MIDAYQAWREPISSEWRAQATRLAVDLKAGGDADDIARRLRRLAGMRLGDGERLKLGQLLRGVRQRSSPLPGFRPFRLLLVSNRTTSFLARDLETAGAARGLLIEAVETDYDSVNALALDPVAAPPPGPFDAVLLLVDAGFLAPPAELLDGDAEAVAAAAAAAHFTALAAGLRGKCQAPVIAATIAVPPALQLSSADPAMAGTAVRHVQSVNEAIAAAARAGTVVPFDLAALAARIGTLAFFDPVRFVQAKVPFSLEASPIVADGLAALIAAMTGRSGRVLVMDLDNTLWGGVVADDGLDGIVLGQDSPTGEAFLGVQRFALELRRRGIILAVCSKNLEDIAREPFRSHPDMLLREEHIAAFVATFDDKASGLAQIARQLDLDVSSLVFLDDNPAERERVRSALPGALVPEVGDDPALFVQNLVTSGFLEQLPLTSDDTRRAAAYQARAEAKALQASIGDYDAYLKSLDMELSIAPFDAVGRARIAQLVQKSNQFNLTTIRYPETEIAAIENDPARLGWQVRLKDRFGDHGIISVLVVDKRDGSWSIDNWVMSCRVLQRGVEEAVIRELARVATGQGARELVAAYRPTARNGLVKDLYARLGFATVSQAAEATAYKLALPQAAVAAPAMRIVLKETT